MPHTTDESRVEANKATVRRMLETWTSWDNLAQVVRWAADSARLRPDSPRMVLSTYTTLGLQLVQRSGPF
jgi:hypothetical protein